MSNGGSAGLDGEIMSKLGAAGWCPDRWCHFNVTFAGQPRGEGSLLSGTYRHLSNALTRKEFSIFVLQICLQRARKSKSEAIFLLSKWSRPVASSSCCWWWCAVYYLWVRLFAPKSVSSRTINFRNRPNSRMQMLPGGRAGKKHSNIVISDTTQPTNAHCPRLKLLELFHLQTFTCCTARQIHAVVVHLQVVFWTRRSFCFWIGHWRDCSGCPDETHE